MTRMLRGQEVVITGGSDGIGLGLARRFVERGATVLVTGRSLDKLDAAARAVPGLRTLQSDAGDPAQREALATYVREGLPNLTWLINNAGIQRRVSLADDHAPWDERQREIDILFAAPVHLSSLLVPWLVAQDRRTTIVNVTSGGAFVPQVFAPVYSASKAALHSYTTMLRHALQATRCRVVEVVPPAVQTALADPPHGAPLDAFCDAVFADLLAGEAHAIGFGPTAGIEHRSQDELAARFAESARRANVRRYEAPTLIAAYRAAHYSVHVDGVDIPLRVDQRAPALDGVLRARGATRWALLTAHNPSSKRQPDEVNAAAQRALVRTLAAKGYALLPALGASPDGSWAEESVLVLDLDEDHANALMVEQGQNAFLVGEVGAPVSLRFTR